MKYIFAFLGLIILLLGCGESASKKLKKDKEEKTVTIKNDSIDIVSLKGLLGKVYSGETTFETSISNLEGVFALSQLEDNRVYKVAFMSNKKITQDDVTRFRINIENTINIKLSENNIYKDRYYSYSNNIYYSFIQMYIDENHYGVSFSLTDKSLLNSKTKTTTDPI